MMPSFPVPVFGAVVLLFLFIRLWTVRGRLGPIEILLAVCAVQAAIIALAQHYQAPGMRPVQPITATLIPPMAWCAFRWTAVRPWRMSDSMHVLAPLTAAAALIAAPGFLDVFVPGAFVVYGVAILLQSNKGPDAQPQAFLVDGNLPSRVWRVIGVALIGVVGLSTHLRTEDPVEDERPRPGGDAEHAVWSRVQAYMADRRPYLDPDLTLARLSRKLGVPAKTLSVAINRETGENVSRYVNGARIAAAQAALMAGESVTAAMLSSGFNTKSNFNREFLRIAGSSPSQWLGKNRPSQADLHGVSRKR